MSEEYTGQSPILTDNGGNDSFPAGVPGLLNNETPTSELSESEVSSPFSIATSTGKRFWTESSSWISSRLIYHTQSLSSSSAYSSLDRHGSITANTSTNHIFNKDRDPTAVERSNLLNITKLVIKELIEWSIGHGHSRTLEADHPPIQHFFIVLEHAMRHGLKPKKGLLGPKKELWDVLQVVEKITMEAMDMTSSIRDLPTVSTHIGRARAWLRVALMQKKLADYFKILIDNREEVLKEFYDPIALMMSDESIILSGILLGLNVIDCNFCLKEEDLDSQQGVIDFSLYLRSSHSNNSPEDDNEQSQMDSVLDQKNYIEELNRHLNATCTNLQTRVETLTTTNALMKEDLAISKNTILSLQDENHILRLRLEQFTSLKEIPQVEGNEIEVPPANLSVTDLSKKLHEERTLRSELERDIELHISQKSEMEVAMTQLEKDIHEKQDIIISLRRQLEDIKTINLEMYKKLQDCEKSVKYKGEFISKLESKAAKLSDTIDMLNEKISLTESELKSCQEIMRSLGFQISEKELKISTIEGDLRIEREVKQSLENATIHDKERIAQLQLELERLQILGLELEGMRKENTRLHLICKDHEATLTDMGVRLSESTLKMEDLREASKGFVEAQWTEDKGVKECSQCNKEFSLTRRKHHCRACGKIFCKLCSDNMMLLAASSKPLRTCDPCYASLLQRFSGSGMVTKGVEDSGSEKSFKR